MNNTSESGSKYLVGKCMGMCPNAEMRLRQRERLIHPLEMAISENGQRTNIAQARFMVKEFSRSAAGHEIKASDIRPQPVLVKTLRYLLSNACNHTDVRWAKVYQFISDRLQAVQQDMCIQSLCNFQAVRIHQAIVRFYIYAHYRTCEHDLSDFDPYLNKTQLIKTLTIMINMYKDLDLQRDPKEEVSDIYKNARIEAEGLYMLVNFGDTKALQHSLELPEYTRSSELIMLVLQMNLSWVIGNYVRVLRLAAHLPPIFICAFHPHLTSVQRKALKVMSHAYSNKMLAYNKEDLAKTLMFAHPKDLVEVCQHYKIEAAENGIKFKKGSFDEEAALMKSRRVRWIEDKLDALSLSELFLPEDLAP